MAIDEKGGIGKAGDLAWHLPSDMAFFKKKSSGNGNNAVIMGRKTWNSIPERYRPLPGRRNIVLTQQAEIQFPTSVLQASSLNEALGFCSDVEDIFVIGGGKVYADALQHPACQTVYLTAVRKDFACDTFFLPKEEDWILHSESEVHTENEISFSFCTYHKKL